MRSRIHYILVIIIHPLWVVVHIECYRTEDQTCKPGICNNGDCFTTSDSITMVPKSDSNNNKCQYGFDHHKGQCFRVDHVQKNWYLANADTDNGQLAQFTLQDHSARYITAEYLRHKLSAENSIVWINLLAEEVTVSKNKPCYALQPANYAYWEVQGCTQACHSLRTTPLLNRTNSNSSIMCRCRPGYTGRLCDYIDTQLQTQELINPDILQCPAYKLIFVEFAVYGYSASVSTGKDCFAPNMLPLLRYLCQGKDKCKLGQLFRIKYIDPFCKNPDATLAVRYSCVNASELSCPHNTFGIEHGNSINCIQQMQENVSWRVAMDYCLENGGQLAAYSSDIHINAVPHVSKFSTSFWTFDVLTEIRPDPREPEECTMTSIEYTSSNTSRVQVVRNCAMKLPGICAIPPSHQVTRTTLDTTTHIAGDYELSPTAQPHTSTEVNLYPLFSLFLLIPIVGGFTYYRCIRGKETNIWLTFKNKFQRKT